MSTTIGILGGAGALGSALAYRWARAGHSVILGSRDTERAAESAQKLIERVPGAKADGKSNLEAAARAEIAVLTVPFANQEETLSAVKAALEGKILIDATVPLRPGKKMTVALPPEGSAAVISQRILGEKVRVVSAFQTVSAAALASDRAIEGDVLVAGDDPAARETVIALIAEAGLRGVHAGPLANSAAAEALTSVLIQINKRYAAEGAGIRILGI
jgi:NADPH-dependent F420 reductase